MLLRWLPALLWTTAIVIASSDLFSSPHSGGLLAALTRAIGLQLGAEELEQLNHLLRKLGHLSAYGLHALLWNRALRPDWPRRSFVGALLISLALASWDEWHQSGIGSRTGTPYDVVVDMIGACTAVLLQELWYQRRRKTGQTKSPIRA